MSIGSHVATQIAINTATMAGSSTSEEHRHIKCPKCGEEFILEEEEESREMSRGDKWLIGGLVAVGVIIVFLMIDDLEFDWDMSKFLWENIIEKVWNWIIGK